MTGFSQKETKGTKGFMNEKAVLAVLVMVLGSSCATWPKVAGAAPDGLEVSVRAKEMRVIQGGRVIKKIPVSTSRYGIGSQPGSRRTPLGEFTVRPEPGHRFGPVLRLDGPQGRRGILVHRDLSRGTGTNGCVAVPDLETARWLVGVVEPGTRLRIEM